MADPTLANTPQATDDSYWWTEDELIASGRLSGNIIALAVLSNDKGGNAKTLWSIDDGNGNTDALDYDLLASDMLGAWENTAVNNLGAVDRVTISNGQILLDLSASLTVLGAENINALAEGDHIRTEFVYAIRLGNGTLSQATVVFELWGANDAAEIGGDTTGSLTEDDTAAATGTVTVADVDHGQSHTQAASNAASLGGLGVYSVDADGHWSYTVNNALVQHLAADETATDTFMIASADGTASTLITVTIHGVADTSILSSDTKDLTETDSAADISTSGLLTISDVDGPTSFVAQPGALGLYGTFAIDGAGAWSYTASSAHDEFAAGEIYIDTFSVASTDGNSTTVTINIAGTNDDPIVAGGVETSASEDDNAPLIVDLLDGASDPDDGDTLHVAGLALVSGDASGVTVDGDSLTVDPDAYNYLASGESAVIIYDYDIVDGNGGSVPQTATITITGEDDGPAAFLYFQARDAANGRELWSYDGTQMALVADINTGVGDADPGTNGGFFAFGGDLYFSASDPVNGYELRKLDGTTGAVSLVADLQAGSAGSNPGVGGFVEFAGDLYFTASTSTHGAELRKLDGTTGAISLVHDIDTGVGGSNPGLNGGFVEFADNLYFEAFSVAHGFELRKLDSTGTVSLVADINAGGGSAFPGQYGFTEFNGALYFTALDATSGNELRKLDSTGTVSLVADIFAGSGNSSAGRYGGFVEYEGDLYFTATDLTTNNYELRKLDGTTGTVSLVANIHPTGSSNAGEYGGFAEFGGNLYFTATDPTNRYELRKLDSTGTVSLVANIHPTGSSDAGRVGGFAEFAGNLYFTANDGTIGTELYKIDGAGALSLVTDLNPGGGSSNAGQDGGFVEFAGDLYFSANNGINGNQLHKIDGTTGAVSLAAGTLASDPRYLTAFTEIV